MSFSSNSVNCYCYSTKLYFNYSVALTLWSWALPCIEHLDGTCVGLDGSIVPTKITNYRLHIQKLILCPLFSCCFSDSLADPLAPLSCHRQGLTSTPWGGTGTTDLIALIHCKPHEYSCGRIGANPHGQVPESCSMSSK